MYTSFTGEIRLMNNYNIIIDQSAFDDLELIYITCKSRYGPSYALKTLAKILKEIYSLNHFPNSNPIHSTIDNITFRKLIVNKRYIIVFRVVENFIFIHFIYDGRRNISSNNQSITN